MKVTFVYSINIKKKQNNQKGEFPEHGLNKLNERLLLFRHDYASTNILQMINAASEVAQDALVEIVMSAHSPSDEVQIRPHSMYVHSYKTPTFCDFCGEMLFGLSKQGLKCEGLSLFSLAFAFAVCGSLNNQKFTSTLVLFCFIFHVCKAYVNFLTLSGDMLIVCTICNIFPV
ncbi:hypothetical protein Anas_07394 [Armadillidium nasatum]|uniref:Phorbol-ester/DAG-type domain-containing protein n=1 Tax=Armadillidium nasatum TaxID=96803 RepID=A0A5N5SHJ0_9CRUS|nr:hypothetical protein Anas_07394 [Armadillidium nasatum]